MSVDETLIHALFPHRTPAGGPSYRTHQFELIRDSLQAFDDGAVDVMIEAPTGVGKTDIAITVARYSTREYESLLGDARRLDLAGRTPEAFTTLGPGQAHMITSMKMLQDAYVKSAPEVVLIKGQGNYGCAKKLKGSLDLMENSVAGLREPFFSCADASSVYGSLCKVCPYKETRHAAQWARLTLHNFDGFMAQASLGGSFVPRAVLTIDEAHNVEEKVANACTLDFYKRGFEDMGITWTQPAATGLDEVTEWAKALSAQVNLLGEKARLELAELRSSTRLLFANSHRVRDLSKTDRAAGELARKLQRFLVSRQTTNPKTQAEVKPVPWVATVDQGHVRLEPVTASAFIGNTLLRFGAHRLHLSATFLDGAGSYRKAVNLRGEARAPRQLSVDSPFAAANRRIVLMSAGDTGAGKFDANRPKVLAAIRRILDRHAGQRGVIHATSYDMARWLEEEQVSPRLLFHGPRNREDELRGFMHKSATDAVFCAVGMSEGVDFKDDMARWQVIVRIPYGVPTARVKARRDVDGNYYDWRTCLTVVQTCGRIVRNNADWGVTYVLDGRFAKFAQRNRTQLPDWFMDAVEEEHDTDSEVEDEIEDF
jgi:Rad3-related DNA helicase